MIGPDSLPSRRPARLRPRRLPGVWWRIDALPPRRWDWTPFPEALHRFDPADARCRVRYACSTERGAFRERFHDRGRRVGDFELRQRLVRLTGTPSVVDLRDERVLDLLNLDGEVSVGRDPRVLAVTRALMERLLDWFGDGVHGVVYGSRTTPRTAANLAFTVAAPLTAVDAGPLAGRLTTLVALVVDDGFTVDAALL